MLDGKKLAGLLCQRVDKADLVGIGINVNTPLSKAPAKLRGQITSLQQLAGREIDINTVLIALATHLRQLLRQRNEKSFASFLEEFRHFDALAGQRIHIIGENGEPPFAASVRGLMPRGDCCYATEAKPIALSPAT